MSNQSSLQVTDDESKAVQKTENRVSLEQIESEVADVEYIHPAVKVCMTLAVVKFKNGYVLIGQSAPADPLNFNQELGRKFAYEDAIRKAWPMFGFALCNKLRGE